ARGVVVYADVLPLTVVEDVGLEQAGDGVDEPVVGDAVAGVEADLVVAVVLGRGRGQDLADPVGDDVDGVEVVGRGEARATPADDVGPDDVVRREADVDLAYDPPAVGAVVVVV